LSRNLRIHAVLDIETRFDALAKRSSVKALCVYDARRFSSGDCLHAVKCHRDHARYPIVLSLAGALAGEQFAIALRGGNLADTWRIGLHPIVYSRGMNGRSYKPALALRCRDLCTPPN
jgi:hypothetical protein